jgi:hypothetical protein
VQLLSDTTALLAVGHEGDHATRLTLDPAALPPSGLGFGATLVAPADGGEAREGETVVAGGRFAFPDAGTDPEGVGGRPETHLVVRPGHGVVRHGPPHHRRTAGGARHRDRSGHRAVLFR